MVASSGQMKLAVERLERAPRIVRVCFVAWLYFFAGTMLGIPIVALLLIPFDPPGILAAGPVQAAEGLQLLVALVIFASPPAVMLLLAEDFAVWRTLRGAFGRIATLLVLSPVAMLLGIASFVLAFHFALPFLANAVTRPAVQTWNLPITSVERKRPAPKVCSITLYFPDPLVSDHPLSLCADHQPELAGVEGSDSLRITGRAGLFGITYSAAELVRH